MTKKRLTYWRATWLGGEVPGYADLEAVFRGIFDNLPDVPSTSVIRADGSVVELRHRRVESGRPLLIHCAMHEPGAEGSVVPKTKPNQESAPLDTIPPPDGVDFLGGALIALIKGNHCLFCSDAKLTIKALRFYIQQLVDKAGLPHQAQRLEFLAVANREKLDEIVSSGVKEVGLSATLDEFDPDNSADSSMITRARSGMIEAISTLFEKDFSVEELIASDHDNVNARLAIKFDGRRQGQIKQEAFDTAARHVIEEEEPGVYIKLRSGSRIDYQNIKLSRIEKIESQGSTIVHSDAWLKLEDFYAELLATGQIEPNEN